MENQSLGVVTGAVSSDGISNRLATFLVLVSFLFSSTVLGGFSGVVSVIL